jgi:hypothetical protein
MGAGKVGAKAWAFELNQFGIGIKTVERGGMKTDFFSSPDPSILGGIQLMTHS